MEKTEREARRIFGNRAAFYSTSPAHTDAQVLSRVVTLASPQSDWVVLDIATGTSPDTNGNGIPDECEGLPTSVAGFPAPATPALNHPNPSLNDRAPFLLGLQISLESSRFTLPALWQ